MLGENLTKFREQKGWTQSKFALQLNAFLNKHGIRDARYNNRTISQWENSQRGPKNTQILTLLAEFMGINLSDMFNTEITTFKNASTSTDSQEKIDMQHIFDNFSMEAYFATLGIYAYDEEKECFLTRFLWADQYLVKNENPERYDLSEVCPYLFPSIDTIETAICLKNFLDCQSEDEAKSYVYAVCRLNGIFSSREEFDEYWEYNDMSIYCSDWMKGYWECYLDECCLNPKNVQAKTTYIDDDVCTVLIEISAELHISKSTYLEFVKELCAKELSITMNDSNDGKLEAFSPVFLDFPDNYNPFEEMSAYYELFRNYKYTI